MRHGVSDRSRVTLLVHAGSVRGGIAGVGPDRRTVQRLHLSALRYGVAEMPRASATLIDADVADRRVC